MPPVNIRAITLDLDDTLWPIGPTLVAAEQRAQDWLTQHAAELRLLRFIVWYSVLWVPKFGGTRRESSPPFGLSILTTLAPRSAKIIAANGPAITEPSSSTRNSR
jgi:FMN phosphatase YigB (HAD superfamily)